MLLNVLLLSCSNCLCNESAQIGNKLPKKIKTQGRKGNIFLMMIFVVHLMFDVKIVDYSIKCD